MRRLAARWCTIGAICLVLALAAVTGASLGGASLAGAREADDPARASLPPIQVPALPQTKAPRAQVEIEVKGELPLAPPELAVYRVRYPKADAAYGSRLASALGISGAVRQEKGSLMARDGARGVEISTETGAFWYRDEDRLWSGAKPTALPDKESAMALASAALRGWGLLPESALFEGMGSSQVTMYDVKTGQSETYKTDLHVNYRLLVDGLPVEGPGGKIKVYLGQGYQISGIYWASFSTELLQAYPVIPPGDAVTQLAAEGIATTVKNPSRATVDQVRLVYYAGPGNVRQAYLEPVYAFRGQVQGEGESRDYLQYVPALPAAYRQEETVSLDDAWLPQEERR